MTFGSFAHIDRWDEPLNHDPANRVMGKIYDRLSIYWFLQFAYNPPHFFRCGLKIVVQSGVKENDILMLFFAVDWPIRLYRCFAPVF